MLMIGRPSRRYLKHLGIVANPGEAPWMTEGTSRVIDGIDCTTAEFPAELGYFVLHGRRVEVLGGHLIAKGSMRIGAALNGKVTADGSSIIGLGRASVRLIGGSDADLFNGCTFVAGDDSIVHVHDGVSGLARDRATVHIHDGATGLIRLYGDTLTIMDHRNKGRSLRSASMQLIRCHSQKKDGMPEGRPPHI